MNLLVDIIAQNGPEQPLLDLPPPPMPDPPLPANIGLKPKQRKIMILRKRSTVMSPGLREQMVLLEWLIVLFNFALRAISKCMFSNKKIAAHTDLSRCSYLSRCYSLHFFVVA